LNTHLATSLLYNVCYWCRQGDQHFHLCFLCCVGLREHCHMASSACQPVQIKDIPVHLKD
jgi:hypothetical protein